MQNDQIKTIKMTSTVPDVCLGLYAASPTSILATLADLVLHELCTENKSLTKIK